MASQETTENTPLTFSQFITFDNEALRQLKLPYALKDNRMKVVFHSAYEQENTLGILQMGYGKSDSYELSSHIMNTAMVLN